MTIMQKYMCENGMVHREEFK